jgi:predicted kinase
MSESLDQTTIPALPERTRVLKIPAVALVVLIGVSGSGKSTFAAQHFLPTEILSSDHFRAVVSDDANNQAATAEAFDALHHIAALRLQLGKLTVIDATNVKPQDRASLVTLAKAHDVLPVAVVLNLDERLCRERNAARPDRAFGTHVVRNQIVNLRRGLRGLEKEGFRYITILNTPAEVAALQFERMPVYSDRRGEMGPFDIIGDIHGCYDELTALLTQLGAILPDAVLYFLVISWIADPRLSQWSISCDRWWLRGRRFVCQATTMSSCNAISRGVRCRSRTVWPRASPNSRRFLKRNAPAGRKIIAPSSKAFPRTMCSTRASWSWRMLA